MNLPALFAQVSFVLQSNTKKHKINKVHLLPCVLELCHELASESTSVKSTVR